MAAARVRILREVETLARMHTKKAIDTLVLVMNDSGAPAAARVTASSAILDRGWGRPQQNISIDDNHEHMSDDDLARQIEQRLAAIAARAGSAGSGAGLDAAGDEAAEGSQFTPRLVH